MEILPSEFDPREWKAWQQYIIGKTYNKQREDTVAMQNEWEEK